MKEFVSYLSVSNVAKKLGVTNVTVINYIKRGELQAIKLGKSWRIAPEEFDTFIENSIYWKEKEKDGNTY
jgi:excisionase family DNA binding protein